MVAHEEIPITAAEELARKYRYEQVVIIGCQPDGHSHVTTFGSTQEGCLEAAELGNAFKELVLEWPDNLCHAHPDPKVVAAKPKRKMKGK